MKMITVKLYDYGTETTIGTVNVPENTNIPSIISVNNELYMKMERYNGIPIYSKLPRTYIVPPNDIMISKPIPEKESEKISINGVTCRVCGSTIVSRTVHEMVRCKCTDDTTAVWVDGGLDYKRRMYGEKCDYVELEDASIKV